MTAREHRGRFSVSITPIRFFCVYPPSYNHQAALAQTQTKRENPNIQSRGLSKRVKTLLVVLIRAERPGGPRDFIASCRSWAPVTGILRYGSKEGEEIRNLPPPWRVFGYFLHEQKVTPPAGCAGCRVQSITIGRQKANTTSDQSKNRGAHRMALRDWPLRSAATTGL